MGKASFSQHLLDMLRLGVSRVETGNNDSTIIHG